MKTSMKMKSIFLLTAILLSGYLVKAQQGRGMMNCGLRTGYNQVGSFIPDLTEAQTEQIQKLRTAHLKEMQDFRNKIGENRARYRTLMTADKPDQKAIDANIDGYTNLRNQVMKKQAAHRQQIRNLLTEEQKVFFDNRGMRGRHEAGTRGRGMSGPKGRW